MKNKLKQLSILAATALMSSIVTLIGGYIYVTLHIVQPFQKEAVDREYASWIVTNTATGATSFQWSEIVPEINVLAQNEKPLIK